MDARDLGFFVALVLLSGVKLSVLALESFYHTLLIKCRLMLRSLWQIRFEHGDELLQLIDLIRYAVGLLVILLIQLADVHIAHL